MTEELNRCMANYTAAHRARESIDVAAASSLASMLKREVPRMSIALRLVSKSEIWGIVIHYINDMIHIAVETSRLTHDQYWKAWELENTWRKAFLKARDEIEVRIVTDRGNLQLTEPLYQMALEGGTSSEGESMSELDHMETDEEDLVVPVDIIHDDAGLDFSRMNRV